MSIIPILLTELLILISPIFADGIVDADFYILLEIHGNVNLTYW